MRFATENAASEKPIEMHYGGIQHNARIDKRLSVAQEFADADGHRIKTGSDAE